jgi:AraC family transcriptional regulator
MAELGLADTNGILRQPWIEPARTSAGLGWERLYVSTQAEQPYRASFGAASTHQLILHLDGPVTVRRGHGGLGSPRRVPPGGMFLHPAAHDLTVELGGDLRTVHVYLAEEAVQEAAERDSRIELAEELGGSDPLIEQLVLGLDGVLRGWEPAARTYVDHLSVLLAAQLGRYHSVRPVGRWPRARPGLSGREFAAVRDMMDARIGEPIPLADLATAVSLSVSQFSRQFKARTGETPHRFLMRLRVEQACRLLRASTIPIAEVAVRSGFSHQEHLCRALRAQLGVTPAEVRRGQLPSSPLARSISALFLTRTGRVRVMAAESRSATPSRTRLRAQSTVSEMLGALRRSRARRPRTTWTRRSAAASGRPVFLLRRISSSRPASG